VNWNFDRIAKHHQKDGFDCGYFVFNEYLKKYARQNAIFVTRPASRTFAPLGLIVFIHICKSIVGYIQL